MRLKQTLQNAQKIGMQENRRSWMKRRERREQK